MEKQDITNFRESVKDFSVKELKNKQLELRDQISKMILDSDLIIKAAIIDTLLKEKEQA